MPLFLYRRISPDVEGFSYEWTDSRSPPYQGGVWARSRCLKQRFWFIFPINVAVTPELAVKLNMQSPVPVQVDAEPEPPLQPAKIEPAFALPERVIAVPSLLTVHVPVLPTQLKVQFAPAVTVPVPVPALVTVRAVRERGRYNLNRGRSINCSSVSKLSIPVISPSP